MQIMLRILCIGTLIGDIEGLKSISWRNENMLDCVHYSLPDLPPVKVAFSVFSVLKVFTD